MRRIIDAVLVVAVFGGAVWTYQIKHAAEQSARRIAVLQKEIDAQRNKITLLRADWSILTAPQRLARVSETFAEELGLEKMSPQQIISRAELPPLRPLPEPRTEILVEAEGDDAVTTGSVTLPTRRPGGIGQ